MLDIRIERERTEFSDKIRIQENYTEATTEDLENKIETGTGTESSRESKNKRLDN
jgi:hypothetical protein